MEYISYILIIIAILLVCFLLMRPPAIPLQKKSLKGQGQKPDKSTDQETNLHVAKRILRRELQRVPTPWGWPGHDESASSRNSLPPNAEAVHGVSESLHHFVERLFNEKHTKDSAEYLLRKDASLRALVEDRYGRASRMKEMPYRQVKAPLLRDPGAPHDQMDNFPGGKLDKIVSGIPKQPGNAGVVKKTAPKKKVAGLDDLRTPWGW